MKKTVLVWLTVLSVSSMLLAQNAPSDRFKPIELNEAYEHTKWGVSPGDVVYHFAAYTTSFDSADDNNEDGSPDSWGVPEWVAFEIKKFPSDEKLPRYRRPSPWLTDDSLHALGLAPNDATYAVSGTRDLPIVKTNYRFVRGHMCPKNAADRLGKNAGYNTHTVLNAVPQLQWQNNGIWKDLEQKCTAWADLYDRVWVYAGPVYFGKNPAMWLGQNNNVKAAIPDAIYKIVIRENPESETGIESLAFIFPNIIPPNLDDLADFLTSIEDIENVTGLTFLTELSANDQKKQKQLHEKLDKEERQHILNRW